MTKRLKYKLIVDIECEYIEWEKGYVTTINLIDNEINQQELRFLRDKFWTKDNYIYWDFYDEYDDPVRFLGEIVND